MRTDAESNRMLASSYSWRSQPGAEADLEPALREHVERGQLLGEHGRFPEVLGEHRLGDAQRGRRVGDGLAGDQRRERTDEVVGEPERRVAERLDRRAESSSLAPASTMRRR